MKKLAFVASTIVGYGLIACLAHANMTVFLGLTSGGTSISGAQIPVALQDPEIQGLDYPNSGTSTALAGTTLTLTANEGQWTGNPTSFTYKWHTIADQSTALGTGRTLTLNTSNAGVLGMLLEVDVTAINAAGSSTRQSHWFGSIESSIPVSQPTYETLGNTGPTGWTAASDIEHFLQNGHAIYPGCDIPPVAPDMSDPTKVFYFDPIHGRTQAAMTTGSDGGPIIASADQGHAANPFKDVAAIGFTTFDGYHGNNGVNRLWGSVITPGSVILIEPGDSTHPVGSMFFNGGPISTSDGTITGTTIWTWIMGDPAAASRPVLNGLQVRNGTQKGIIYKNFDSEPAVLGDELAGINGNPGAANGVDVLYEGIHVSSWIGHASDPWSQSRYPNSGGTSDGTVVTASSLMGPSEGQDPLIINVTMAAGAKSFTAPSASIPPPGEYAWSPGYFRTPSVNSTGIPSGTVVHDVAGLTKAHWGYTGQTLNGFQASDLTSLASRGNLVSAPTVAEDDAGYYLVAANSTTSRSVYTWNKNLATLIFSAQPAAGSNIVVNGTTWTFVASGATGNQVNLAADLSHTMTALAAALNASADTNTAKATYAASASVLTMTFKTSGANLPLTAGTSGATPTSWTAIGTIVPTSYTVTDFVYYLTATSHLAHWDGSTWTDIGAPVITLSACDPVADAAKGCPTTNYPGLSSNVPGCDPKVTISGVLSGGCPAGTPPAWNGTTRAMSNEGITFTALLVVTPAGYFTTADWGRVSSGISLAGAVDSVHSQDPSNPNVFTGLNCISFKDNWSRDNLNSFTFYAGTDEVAYNNRSRIQAGDVIDVYGDHRAWIIHNYGSDATQVMAHMDGVQWATASGESESSVNYSVAAIENEMIEWTDPTNPLPSTWQGIDSTDDVWMGAYIADNVVVSNGNGLDMDGVYNVMVNNVMLNNGAGLGAASKPGGAILPTKGLLANNVANGLSRDGHFGANLCDPVLGDQLTMETNLQLPMSPIVSLLSTRIAVSPIVCNVDGTYGSFAADSTPGVYQGFKAWGKIEWAGSSPSPTSLFQDYSPLSPPVQPNPGAGLIVNPQLFSCLQLSQNPFDCKFDGMGVFNPRPNPNFAAVNTPILGNARFITNLPQTGSKGDAYMVQTELDSNGGFALSAGPNGYVWLPGVYVRSRTTTTVAANDGDYTQWAFTGSYPNPIMPPFTPGLIGQGTALGAQMPLADIDGKPWANPPSIGAYELH